MDTSPPEPEYPHTLMDKRLGVIVEGITPFLEHLDLNRNYSPHTLRAYARDLRVFIAWLETVCEEHSPDSPQEIDHFFRHLPTQYLGYLNHQQLARNSLSRKLSALKSFFKFLMKEQYVPARSLPLSFHQPKPLKTLPNFLTPDEVRILLEKGLPEANNNNGNNNDNDSQTEEARLLNWRNRAIILLLYTSGIRVAELTGLTMDHIDRESGEFRVTGKGNRDRVCFMSRETLAALTTYLEHWPTLAKTEAAAPTDPLFINRFGNRISTRSVGRMLETVAQTAGWTKPLSPHIFRHTFATHLLNHGTDLRVVQELLGHVSIRSTQIYTHLTTERLKRAYLKAHPRAMENAGMKDSEIC